MSTLVKHPRIAHLPWSQGKTSDDVSMSNIDYFKGKEVVVTLKMDGEQTTFYQDYKHTRSLEWANHPSRTWAANLHGRIKYLVPKDWRICGENVFACHSIEYHNLDSYFYMFEIWDNRNICLAWDDTFVWADLIGLTLVPILYEGKWDEELIKNLYRETYNNDEMEGYVVRLADAIPASKYNKSVAKFVRANHVKTDQHWLNRPVVKNQLR